jgi:ElaB/YqjD/DUF883 family membrane-anchored ribosome-binding protein
MSASERWRSSSATGADEPREPEEIREDIDQTREELGDTVAAMAEKTDVKKQAQAKAEELKGQAQRIAQENPPMALAGAFVAGFLLGKLFSR